MNDKEMSQTPLSIWVPMRIFAATTLVVVVAAPIVSCSEEGLACRSGSSSYYQEALSKQLDKMGIQHKRGGEHGVCVAKPKAADLERAATVVDNFHREVAINPRDACEEKAMTAWLAKEGLPFIVSPTVDMEGKPAGNLIQLPALVPEDVSRYRQRLESAPKDSRCPKT